MTSRGSEWHRWGPHIYAPGTILNNQFGAADPWGACLTSLENATPKIEAIAITDYYATDTYEEFLKYSATGRLPGVKLLFPNIELRLDAAAKSGFVNIHLLISPEDPDHLSEVTRILKRLQFHAFDDCFDCTRDELIKLGKRANRAMFMSPEIVGSRQPVPTRPFDAAGRSVLPSRVVSVCASHREPSAPVPGVTRPTGR